MADIEPIPKPQAADPASKPGCEAQDSHPEKIESRLLWGMGLVFAVLAFVAIQAVRNTLQTRETSAWVNNTHAVLLEAQSVLSSLHALEAAQASVLLRGQPADLDRLRQAQSSLAEHLQVAQALTVDNPRQVAHIATIAPLVGQQIAFSQRLAEARRAQGNEAAGRLFASSNPGVSSSVESSIKKMAVEENELLLQRDRASLANARKTRLILFAGTALNAILLLGAYLLVRDDLRVRRAHQKHLMEVNEILEQKVRERTAELAASNEALSIENLERKWAYASLEKNYRHGELIVEALAEVVLLVGATGLVHRSNPAGEQAMGLPAGGLVGRKLNSLLRSGETFGPWSEHPVRLAMQENRPLRLQTGSLLRDDGSAHAMTYLVWPIEDSGKVVMAIVALTLGSERG